MNFTRITPYNQHPRVISEIYERIPYQAAIGLDDNLARYGVNALYIPVIEKLTAGTSVRTAQTWASTKDDVQIEFGQRVMPYYEIFGSYSVTSQETASYDANGMAFSPDTLKENVIYQTFAQRKAHIALFGADVNQGIFYTNTNVIPLPNDSDGQNKLGNYNPADLFTFLLTQIGDMNSAGYGTIIPITLVAPIEAINAFRLKIVPLNSLQQSGGGTDTVASGTNDIMKDVFGNYEITYVPCSYMKGKGTAGVDSMLFIAPVVNHLLPTDKNETNALNAEGVINTMYANTVMDSMRELVVKRDPEIQSVYRVNFSHLTTPAALTRTAASVRIDYEFA